MKWTSGDSFRSHDLKQRIRRFAYSSDRNSVDASQVRTLRIRPECCSFCQLKGSSISSYVFAVDELVQNGV